MTFGWVVVLGGCRACKKSCSSSLQRFFVSLCT